MKLRNTAAIALAVAMPLGLAACGGGSSSGSGNKVKIGIKYDQPGLGFKDGNKYTGFDVAVATYVAGKMGYKPDQIEWVESPSKQREKMLQAGTVKMIFATYSITAKRQAVVSFAGPYFVAGQSVLVKADSPINSVDALKGKKVCSVTGSTSVDNLKKKQPALVPQNYDTYSNCASALADGVIDAMTTDDTILAGYANQDAYKGKFKLVGGTFSEEKYGVGLKKGDTATCQKVNEAIKAMIDDGSWKKALQENLGSNYKFNTSLNPPKQDACS
ncbi:glutamate ABC transporter substrate-binding protein [Calidifontibacter sp. DB0510]|uniref:Glutamate ABC transporter substrate-binding protein n=1 Tax=Metallococcus carri TaxID=1656884 RepID=A0A967EHQ4_9MICO|nr:glutamate ABC transporter substrate-binding protein [Metallococcus carri]NHN56793.1 glutamate ABC transporter substrate-binding protein [Metallococcus carri]NOP37830.1 glutamate ABC transporter substrate-binding protein [Calidifontibacter sp. DB2511S]